MIRNRKTLQSNPRAPLALAAVVFGCGIWMAGHVHRPAWHWASAALAFVVCAMLSASKDCIRLGYISAVGAVTCAGALSWVWMPSPNLATPPQEFLYSNGVEVSGHITSDGELLAGSEPRERFDLESESIQIDDQRFTQPVGIRAALFIKQSESDDDNSAQSSAAFPKLVYGDRVKFTAKLRLPRNFRNPGSFDYEGYLHGLSITTLASVPVDKVELLPGKIGGRLGFWRSHIRRSILEHVHNPKLWSEEDAALFAAMVVGDDSLLLRHVREEFQETGVYHLLVVSGMNVGLLALAVFWLARRLRAPEWAASLVTIALSLFYAFVAGMGTPILRAVFMLALLLLARLFYRDRAALNATGFAALVVMVLSPQAWFDPSFQLTFLALLAISGISLPLLERTSSRLRQALAHFESTNYDLTLGPRLAQLRLDLRLIIGRVARFLGKLPARLLVLGVLQIALMAYELIVVSTITQAVMVLPMRVYFHRAAIIGLPANILVLPLAGIMMNAGVVAIALSYIFMPLARIASWLATISLRWTLFCIVSLSHWKISLWRIANPGILISLVATAGILLTLAAVRKQRSVAASGIALLFLSAALAAFYRPAAKIEPGKLEVTAIDVGQGDSLLVISPEGRTMLIDGGGPIGRYRGEFDYGEDVVSPYLWARGLNQLDVIVLTHAHGDHISGLPRIVQNFRPRELWLGINPETPALSHLYRAADLNHVQVLHYRAGDTFAWGGAHIRILSPPPDWQTKPQPKNDDSLAFLVSYGRTTALLAGDLEKKMERFIADESPQADLLKVAHHGSATSTTPELLAAAQPHFAVISVGAHNTFGHPRQAVLQRLQEAHVSTYRTDMLGAITFLLDGTNVEPRLANAD